ncbi:MAG: prepilin-type N-terminal cleavage/methylation domain-containing protein [Dehalococcoidia bacterium]
MKKLRKGEKGLTLLELIIAIAITSLITGGIAMIVYQIYTGSTRSANHMVAVREVQDTGYWLSEYAYSAQNATITGVSGFPLILQWVNFDPSGKHKIVFNLDSSGLRGSYYVAVSDDSFSLDSVRTGKIPVFEFINSTKTNCQVSGGSDFSLPVSGNKFVITRGATNDSGRITTAPSGDISKILVNATAGATATYDSATKAWTWNTTAAGGTITVTATSAVKGSWTSETKAATAAITQGTGATLSSARGLVFNVTAIVGAGGNAASETRIYKAVPKSVS